MRRAVPLLTPVLSTSDRVPRFSRLERADSVRLLRFNMALPSHPPSVGGGITVRVVDDEPRVEGDGRYPYPRALYRVEIP